jgi:hypothetical protein
MILTKTNILYFAVALLVGCILAFGYAGLSYHPSPLQVQLDPYAPLPPAAPAEPTLAPQPVPGSAADHPPNPNDPYAPAQAPVVVTTQPLPSITPVPTARPNGCETLSPQWNQSLTQANEAFNVMTFMPIVVIGIGIMAIIVGALSGQFSSISADNSNTLSTSLNTTSSVISNSVGTSGVVGIIVASAGVMLALYIIAVVIGSMTTPIMCV